MTNAQPHLVAVHHHTDLESAPNAEASDERADLENTIVTEHLSMARSLANRFAGRGPERDDLYQVAYLGLVKAARRYDPDKGSFASFAAPTVLGELKRHFRDRGWMVRPPRWVQELQVEIRRITEDRLQAHSDPPSDEELARLLDTDVGRIREARGARGCFAPRSIDTAPSEAARPLAESLAVEDRSFELAEDLASLGPACRRLDEADRRLLCLRFVEDRTQQDIADELGISQMQVSRRLRQIFDRLRDTLLGDDEPLAA